MPAGDQVVSMYSWFHELTMMVPNNKAWFC